MYEYMYIIYFSVTTKYCKYYAITVQRNGFDFQTIQTYGLKMQISMQKEVELCVIGILHPISLQH